MMDELSGIEQALLDETHLAENRLIKIRKLKKKLRKLNDRKYEDLCGAIDIIHARIDVAVQSIKELEARLNTVGASGVHAVAQALKETEARLSGLEKAYECFRGEVLSECKR